MCSSLMPLRIFMVTGRSPAPATASRRIARSRGRLYGSAEPPPLRVTLGTGQPKFRSMWSARSSSAIMRTALPTVAGSTPYSWIERGFSVSSKWISCMVFSLRSTSARVVIISLTNRPLPPQNSRHRVRNGRVGDARHGGEHDGRPHGVRADRCSGGNAVLSRLGLWRVRAGRPSAIVLTPRRPSRSGRRRIVDASDHARAHATGGGCWSSRSAA